MARPKKNTVTEVEPTTEKVQNAPVENTVVPSVTETPKEEPTPSPFDLRTILPEMDRVEMDRYFRVINNSEQASRIMQAVSHQRDLEMWGVHQYDKSHSRNTYARSFYFKDRQNAVKALDYANKLLG